jgi:hypothetical protein
MNRQLKGTICHVVYFGGKAPVVKVGFVGGVSLPENPKKVAELKVKTHARAI